MAERDLIDDAQGKTGRAIKVSTFSMVPQTGAVVDKVSLAGISYPLWCLRVVPGDADKV